VVPTVVTTFPTARSVESVMPESTLVGIRV